MYLHGRVEVPIAPLSPLCILNSVIGMKRWIGTENHKHKKILTFSHNLSIVGRGKVTSEGWNNLVTLLEVIGGLC